MKDKIEKEYIEEAIETLLLNHETVYKKKSDEGTSLQGVVLAANLQELFERALAVLEDKKYKQEQKILVADTLPILYLLIFKI